jgi:hypothetical protein
MNLDSKKIPYSHVYGLTFINTIFSKMQLKLFVLSGSDRLPNKNLRLRACLVTWRVYFDLFYNLTAHKEIDDAVLSGRI